MVRRVAINSHLQTQAEDHASREARIAERILEIREAATEQSLKMLRWPLAEQRVVRDEDGEEVTYVFMPARWAKGTAIQLAHLAAGAVVGTSVEHADEEGEWDLSDITEEEIVAYLEIDSKIRARGRRRPRE